MHFKTPILLLASLARLAQSYTTPTTGPEGNAITRPLLEIVPVGEPFEVTWDPTTKGTVTLVLLRGPSENVQPLYAIAEKIANNGKFEWTPKDDLEPDTTHYGLQIIDDATGQYQWSTQFGIKNDDYSSSSSGSASTTAASKTASDTASAKTTTTGATVWTT